MALFDLGALLGLQLGTLGVLDSTLLGQSLLLSARNAFLLLFLDTATLSLLGLLSLASPLLANLLATFLLLELICSSRLPPSLLELASSLLFDDGAELLLVGQDPGETLLDLEIRACFSLDVWSSVMRAAL